MGSSRHFKKPRVFEKSIGSKPETHPKRTRKKLMTLFVKNPVNHSTKNDKSTTTKPSACR